MATSSLTQRGRRTEGPSCIWTATRTTVNTALLPDLSFWVPRMPDGEVGCCADPGHVTADICIATLGDDDEWGTPRWLTTEQRQWFGTAFGPEDA